MTKNLSGPLCLAAALTVCTAVLAGCGGDGYNLTEPPFASSPACGTLIGKLPDELGGYDREESDVTGAAAWGAGGEVIVYCGMPEPESGGDCVDEGGVGWVARKPADDRTVKMFSTQGRDPGVQVRLRNESTDTSAALTALAPAVRDIEAGEPCAAAG